MNQLMDLDLDVGLCVELSCLVLVSWGGRCDVCVYAVGDRARW